MNLLAIDPGPRESAAVILDTESSEIVKHGYEENEVILNEYLPLEKADYDVRPGHLAVEMVKSYGMAVGDSVFHTCVWIGRFIEAWGGPYDKIIRKEVCSCVCNDGRASDSNIRQALIDRWGGVDGEAKAIGGKKCKKCKGKGWFGRGRPECPRCEGSGWEHPPGPLYGITGDQWAALAVGVTWVDRYRKENT